MPPRGKIVDISFCQLKLLGNRLPLPARLGCRRPFELARQKPRIGHIGQVVPLHRRAGEDKRALRVLAQRRVDGQGGDYLLVAVASGIIAQILIGN